MSSKPDTPDTPDTPNTPSLPELLLLCMDAEDITAFNTALATHWPTPKIKITPIHSRLQDLPRTTSFNLIVSPANSYGRLDGAFDDAISRTFCLPDHHYATLTRAVQRTLYKRRRGFLPPGNCEIVRFPEELRGGNGWGCEMVAICPTMRVPGNVEWDREVVYECVWSLMCAVESWNGEQGDGGDGCVVERVLMTPLATGVGRVSRERWAGQFVLALKHFVDAVEEGQGEWEGMEWPQILSQYCEVEGTWKKAAE